MKLKLISPKTYEERIAPVLGLLTLASVTPDDVEVSITDESVGKINFEEEVDMVGITVMTNVCNRAYEIADVFKRIGKTVVLGGVHPSALPEEAIQHADSVVIGEGEKIWPKVIHDFKSRKLKKFYQCEEWLNLKNLPIPRRDLVRYKSYIFPDSIETSRGCPFQCTFCSVSSHFGKTYRCRPIKDVIQEVKAMKSKRLFFVDVNIVGIPHYAKELFKALLPYKKKWICQATVAFGNDEELLTLAAQSGCFGVFIGFESLSPASLKEANKSFNVVKRYKENIDKIHDHGISIYGSFIFGFDHDDIGVFERTIRFVEDTKIDLASFAILTPYPGTPLCQKLTKEGRIITRDWSKYGHEVVFQPKLMSPETLFEGTQWAFRECYSYKSIFKRLGYPNRLWPIRFLVNLGFRKHFVKGC